MSIPAAMNRRWRQARWRALLTPLLLALAPLLALTWAWPQGWPMAVLVGLAALAWGGWCARRLDRHWLALQLDARVPELEDSSGLLLGLEAPRSGLAQAQMARLRARLPTLTLPDLRAAWPWRATLASGLLAVALALLLTHWPSAEAPVDVQAPVVVDPPAAVSEPAWRFFNHTAATEIYTGLPLARSDEPVATAPAGSTLRWQWQLDGPDQCQQCDVRLRFHDDSELPLQRDIEGQWSAERALPEDTYYRLLVDGQPLASPDGDSGPWRLHAVVDQPPQIRVIEPTRTLTVLEQAQGQWPLQFEVSDDYGLGEAELQITLAQGSGEQITVAERRQRLRGEGDERQRSYRHRLNPAALGFAQGDDLIIRLQVADRAQPRPQRSVSASYILRWPARQAAEASGVEVSVQKAMPAYFRSQRQIIIDTEALIAARFSPPAGQTPLSADEFAERADLLGVDQRILRLRYGQFLGEEAEGAPSSELQGRVAALREDGDDHDDHDDHEAHDQPEDRSAAADQHAGHDHGEGGADEGDGGFGSA
ncbi:MAG: hypothetical protein KDI48_15100, partial [Xanthomonadales bacterium]|nr:hypothetical protein [Xanthomonadales bacterium]